MMKFYRRLTPIKALSFDLDDTLYSNHPIMRETEQQMLSYFNEHFPQTTEHGNNAGKAFWRKHRAQALMLQPELIDDVTKLRLYSYQLAIKSLGYSTAQSDSKAQAALAHFTLHRSNFSLPKKSYDLLQQLAQHFPLVAITNGNVDVDKLGLRTFFQRIYTPGNGTKRKPHDDMFTQACQHLAIKNQQLLHIGDCGSADILGALQAGCQTVWLNKYNVGKPLSVLPHIELSRLDHLLAFC